MNTGRIAVSNKNFYCGAVDGAVCQLALKSDIPEAVDLSNYPTLSFLNNKLLTRYELNSINIDEEFNENYVCAISEEGHMSVSPIPFPAWLNIFNIFTGHFVSQLAFTCSGSNISSDRSPRLFFRERYFGDGYLWSNWIEFANTVSLEECFQSVSSGKTLLANAITGKGVATSSSDTFATMASNINNISSDFESLFFSGRWQFVPGILNGNVGTPISLPTAFAFAPSDNHGYFYVRNSRTLYYWYLTPDYTSEAQTLDTSVEIKNSTFTLYVPVFGVDRPQF